MKTPVNKPFSPGPEEISLRPAFVILLLIVALLPLANCGIRSGGGGNSSREFNILSGSENKSLEPILEQFERANGIKIKMHYKGSVDIMTELDKGDLPFDAVWPAQRLWIALGDTKGRVKRVESIMTSPVVFAIKENRARVLGFVGRDVYIKDILKAIQEKNLRFAMTSASQSNSGAMAYLGFLNALAGNPDILTLEHLQDPKVREGIIGLLGGVNRSSGSSEWLKETFAKGELSAMVNYEALVIELNNELIRSGKEPLYVIYPRDGLAVADSPLGFIARGNEEKEQQFIKLQEYLRSDAVQDKLLELGRRTGVGGTVNRSLDHVFNPAWGIDAKRVISPIPTPAAPVVFEALRLYQSEFRKPSFTVFCLDYSGSMEGAGAQALKQAMTTLLDPAAAKQYLIQPSGADIIVVIPFSNRILDTLRASGKPEDLKNLLASVRNRVPDGGTDIYTPSIQALRMIADEPGIERYLPSVVLMTDGESNEGANYAALEAEWGKYQPEWERRQMTVPIFTITFGSASVSQVNAIADLTRARVFDGSGDLVDAFKRVRGYN